GFNVMSGITLRYCMGFSNAPPDMTREITAMIPKKAASDKPAHMAAFLILLMMAISIIIVFIPLRFFYSFPPHLPQNLVPFETKAPHLGHWLDAASGTVILDFAAKYFPMILPFIPIMDAVLMTRSAIITDG